METKHTLDQTTERNSRLNTGLETGFFRLATQNKRLRRKGGFSLVEILIVIAVIAIIAAIAIPAIGNTNEAAKLAKSKRNAQNIATMFMAAETAGVTGLFVSGDLSATIKNVVDGGTVSDGAFAGEFFGVPGLSVAEQTLSSAFLELNDSMLVYRSDG